MSAVGTPLIGTVAENTSGLTTLNVPYPASLPAGHMMVLGMASSVASLPSLPAGWTSVFLNSVGAGANAPSMMVAIKKSLGTESGSLAVTTSTSTSIGQILAFPNVNLTTPQDATATFVDNSVATGSSIIPSLTTTYAGTALVYFAAENSTVNNATPPTSPGTFTETADRSGGGARTGTMGYLLWGGVGATGTVTITWSGSARNLGVLLALRPSSAQNFFQMF